MSRSESLVQEQFDDMAQQHHAATLGMWVFLATEVLFFGALFLGYTAYRTAYPEAFRHASEHMKFWLGTINTGVLLTSSLTMALAVHAAQSGDRGQQAKYLAATILLGVVFLGIKAIEYRLEWQEHLVPGAGFRIERPTMSMKDAQLGRSPKEEMFFVFYFIMTGLHAVHMIAGIGVLTALIVLARRGRFTGAYFAPVEMTGLYWHFVDVVWIFLYPTFYLVAKQ